MSADARGLKRRSGADPRAEGSGRERKGAEVNQNGDSGVKCERRSDLMMHVQTEKREMFRLGEEC